MICIPIPAEVESRADAMEAVTIRGGVHSMAEVLRELLPHYGIDPPKECFPIAGVSFCRVRPEESDELVIA